MHFSRSVLLVIGMAWNTMGDIELNCEWRTISTVTPSTGLGIDASGSSEATFPVVFVNGKVILAKTHIHTAQRAGITWYGVEKNNSAAWVPLPLKLEPESNWTEKSLFYEFNADSVNVRNAEFYFKKAEFGLPTDGSKIYVAFFDKVLGSNYVWKRILLTCKAKNCACVNGIKIPAGAPVYACRTSIDCKLLGLMRDNNTDFDLLYEGMP